MSKYIDITACMHVIGNIFHNPKLLSYDDRYKFTEDDFPEEFQKIVFGTIYNLYQLGSTNISLININDYLAQRPKKAALYKANKGDEYILKCQENITPNTFDYYYNRMKKMTLLRSYHNMLGIDLSWLYDEDNIFDSKKKQEQEDWLDNATLEDIAKKIDDKISEIKMNYVHSTESEGSQIGDGVLEWLEELKETPALGYPLFGKYMNTVTRGARLGKFFLRSAPTGVGKTRAMIADMCYIGCSQMYDLEKKLWIPIGAPQPSLFIATEQDLKEVQTMAIAFIAGVDEERILKGEYFAGEWERVSKAAALLKQSKLYFECIPDFSLTDIENLIKKHIREHNILYCAFDYIHTSAKILGEVGGKSGIKNLREDNILFLLSTKLKDICVEYGIWIESATQLNGSYTDSDTPDQNLLRGSKAIADRIDWGAIMLDVTPEDVEKLQTILNKNKFIVPNVKLSIYKCRQGRWKSIYLWMKADKGLCRFEPIFATTYGYELLDIEDIKIKVEESSAF